MTTATLQGLNAATESLLKVRTILINAPVSQLCEALKTMGRAGTTVGAEALVKQLQVEYEQLERTLACGGFLRRATSVRVALQLEHLQRD